MGQFLAVQLPDIKSNCVHKYYETWKLFIIIDSFKVKYSKSGIKNYINIDNK